MKDKAYKRELDALHLHLVEWQTRAIVEGRRTVIVFEGRDAAGKDGSIKALIPRLSTRNTRIAALPKPTERQRTQWYFQRFVEHLPSAGELVLFNRSWYNRAGVEPVNGFCTPEQAAAFLDEAPAFERMLTAESVQLIKVWLDISKDEQAERLQDRATNPLKALKRSPLDAVAQAKWDDYTAARDAMLTRTSTPEAPWVCVRADRKDPARLNLIRWLLGALGAGDGVEAADEAVVFAFEPSALTDGRLAR